MPGSPIPKTLAAIWGSPAPSKIPRIVKTTPTGKVQLLISFTISVFCCVRRISIISERLINLLPASPRTPARIQAKRIPGKNPTTPKRYVICPLEIINSSNNFQIRKDAGTDTSSPRKEDSAVTTESSLKRSPFNCLFSVPNAINIPYSLALKRKNSPEAYTVNTKHPTAVTPRSRDAIFLVSPPSGRNACTVGPKYISEKEVTRRTDKNTQKLNK